MYQVKTILVPVDFTDLSRAAISAAVQLGSTNAASGARIIAFHVRHNLHNELQSQIVQNPDENTITDDIIRDEEALSAAFALEYERIAACGRSVTAVPMTPMVTGGDWVEVALQIIQDEEVDIIVAATHGGPKGLKGWLFGSATERLVHHSTCSVWVVKPKGFPYLQN